MADEKKYEFDEKFQKKIVTHMLRDEAFMRQTEGLVEPGYFDDPGLSWLSSYANDFFHKFHEKPSFEIVINDVKAFIGQGKVHSTVLDPLKKALGEIYGQQVDLSNRQYMSEQVAEFARKKAFESALVQGAELFEKGKYEKAAELMDSARRVGLLDEGVSYEYWSGTEARVKERLEKQRSGSIDGITTGIKEIDDSLYHHGWGRKELSVLMGPPKIGKSIALAEFALNASKAGFHVLYLTLENSAEITQDRMDANTSGVSMRDLLKEAVKIKNAADAKAVKAGKLFVHEFPTGSLKPSAVARLVQSKRAMGVIIDLVVIDYADIMAPDHFTGAENTDSKEIYKGIRAIAQQENCAVLTATQTNREGAKAQVAKTTDVSEDINRVRLADVFIILAATDQEKADEQLRIYFGAMRNSESGIMFACQTDRRRMTLFKSVHKDVM